MTQEEKMLLLKESIKDLYEKEGRTINYIARLFKLDRSTLSRQIREWDFTKKHQQHINPSTQKFINKNKTKIIAMLREGCAINKIASTLSVSKDKIYYIIKIDADITKAKEIHDSLKENKQKKQRCEHYKIVDLPNEEWKRILGYSKYYASNKGRIKKYLKKYDCYQLLIPTPNSRTKRLYISLINDEGKRKNLLLARVIAHTFCKGYCNGFTVDHIDGNFLNNSANNLQWVSQAENNKRAYKNGRPINRAFSSMKFDKIILDDKYEFKTITALAKFLNKSPTQVRRYIKGECSTEHKIKLINNKCNDYPVKE